MHLSKVTSALLFALLVVMLWPVTFNANAQIRFGKSSSTIDVSYSNPKTYEIGGITVSGVKFLDQNAVINLTGLKIGDQLKVPSDKLSSSIKKLWDQGILSDIEVNLTTVENNRIFLDFKLKERSRLAKFTFRGTKKGETDDLREKLHLIRGRIVTDAMLKNTQTTIKKFFIEKGYYNCTVNIVQIEDTTNNNGVTLRIEVDKQSKVKISSINFSGNKDFDSKMLKSKMKETKEVKWYRFFKASKFIKGNYEKDKKAIIDYYNKQGYRDANITFDTIIHNSKNTIKLDINIEEGQKYYFRKIEWKGNFIYNAKTLSDILGVKKGDVYNMETLEKKLNYNPNGYDVSSLYMDDGYLFFRVEPIEVAIEKDSIDIEMRVYEGAQATINKINIYGNTKTSDWVVRREIRTLPGQKFSRAALIRTQRELSQLGYFNPEAIGIQPLPDPAKGTVDINYTVEERPSDQIELSGGWGGFYGFIGTLGLTFSNFSAKKIPDLKTWNPLPAGDGQRLSLRIQANGRAYQTYSASFTEPWLGGKKPHSLTTSFSYSVQNTSYLGTPSELSITGVNVGLGRRLKFPDDFFTHLLSLNLQRYHLTNYPIIPAASSTKGSDQFTNGPATGIAVSNTFARNSIDNPTFPTNGSNISLQVSATPPYSLWRGTNYTNDAERFKWIEYYKAMFDATWYTPLAKNLVLQTRTHMGFLGSYNSKQGIGPFERFKLGGAGLSGFNFLLGYDIIGLRGYDDNSIVPQTGLSAGIVYNKWVSELRYAITTNPSATVFMLAFLEAGNNWGNYKAYNAFDLYKSYGAGVRIFMPAFGMLGLDYGIPFDTQPNLTSKKGGQIHFTIGQQIR